MFLGNLWRVTSQVCDRLLKLVLRRNRGRVPPSQFHDLDRARCRRGPRQLVEMISRGMPALSARPSYRRTCARSEVMAGANRQVSAQSFFMCCRHEARSRQGAVIHRSAAPTSINTCSRARRTVNAKGSLQSLHTFMHAVKQNPGTSCTARSEPTPSSSAATAEQGQPGAHELCRLH
jgi:hypothetical protein